MKLPTKGYVENCMLFTEHSIVRLSDVVEYDTRRSRRVLLRLRDGRSLELYRNSYTGLSARELAARMARAKLGDYFDLHEGANDYEEYLLHPRTIQRRQGGAP